ncbi:MAG: sulfate ABC transporter permease subunit CysW [Pseudanabaena sp. M57BS1SP1A06MG]|nr:sulfate ABC transporter permease subunit CysW [Pseudanabaena sp. M53BS1SP1A06MG]MCA6584252.1 sulfate ABC transporter permease subunit CysW [Pseudanabaena sp. M34BS1SP1A06MG]MCA6592950.1 sulfate ABC transporter permease subunit CysW [Pseudanabaena sp. M38BS1SP1A06MG]MCA6600736.1 sulfate ABC transporter permease subunit CysW [Pseudanabaena sp. M57BS1SP1A06MG]
MANLNSSVSEYPQSAPKPTQIKKKKSFAPVILITIAIAYLSLVLLIPAANVFYEAFHKGMTPLIDAFKREDLWVAIKLTASLAAIALPLNTIFGLSAAWAIARNQFPGKALLLSIIDLPFSISPVVAGLMIVLLYGRLGWFGSWLEANDIKIIFAFPGMLMATIFVSMPFIAREVIPVLDEMGTEQEEAARTLGASDWQIFWKVVIPNIRWGLLYGLVLTNARAMGEFGAVSVVSGNIAAKTQSLPLFVEESYKNYENEVAYSAAVLLALLAVVTLVLKEILERKTHNPNERE